MVSSRFISHTHHTRQLNISVVESVKIKVGFDTRLPHFSITEQSWACIGQRHTFIMFTQSDRVQMCRVTLIYHSCQVETSHSTVSQTLGRDPFVGHGNIFMGPLIFC